MADIIPPGFAEATLTVRHSQVNRAAAVVFGVTARGGDASPDVQAGLVFTAFMDTLGLRLDAHTTIGPLRLAIGQDGGDPVLGFSGSPAQGGRTMNSTSPAVAALLRKRSALGGRRGRGRMYLPWACAEADVSEGGFISGTTLSGLREEADNFLEALQEPGTLMPMVLLHSPGTTPVPPPTPVTQLQAEEIVATQRRRQQR